MSTAQTTSLGGDGGSYQSEAMNGWPIVWMGELVFGEAELVEVTPEQAMELLGYDPTGE